MRCGRVKYLTKQATLRNLAACALAGSSAASRPRERKMFTTQDNVIVGLRRNSTLFG